MIIQTQGSFKKYSNKHSNAEKVILTLMSTQHMGSRCYTSDLTIVTIDISEFVTPWHQGLYPGTQQIGVKCPQPLGDSLLHVGVCYKMLASQVILNVSQKLEITGLRTTNWTCD
jgi:hypothetical protein